MKPKSVRMARGRRKPLGGRCMVDRNGPKAEGMRRRREALRRRREGLRRRREAARGKADGRPLIERVCACACECVREIDR